MIFDKSSIQRHEYKVIKRSQTKYLNSKPKSSIVYKIYRRIRWFGIWFWWSSSFNHYSCGGQVNYNTIEHLTLEDAKKHIEWVINLDRNDTMIIFEDTEITNLNVKDTWPTS